MCWLGGATRCLLLSGGRIDRIFMVFVDVMRDVKSKSVFRCAEIWNCMRAEMSSS
jgi:hypothetical protein